MRRIFRLLYSVLLMCREYEPVTCSRRNPPTVPCFAYIACLVEILIFPQTVWGRLRGSYGGRVCLDRCSARACPANSPLFAVHSCLSTSSMCISTAQPRKICLPAAGASSDCALVVAPCAFSHTVVTFRGRRKGNLVFWRFKVDFS